MFVLNLGFLLIMILLSVGFFTLLERSVLSYIQYRKGPNKVGYIGLLQPFSDGLKLFSSESIWPLNSNLIIYYFCPVYSLIQSLFIWVMYPFLFNCINFNYGLLFFLVCSSLSVYGLMVCGWSSNSVYSMLGCIRSISQAVSYEVSLSLILLCYFLLIGGYNFSNLGLYQSNIWFLFISFPLFICWLSCCMAETNRSPFDFSEGESELVSGFNVEYSSGGFAFLFIAEYSSIIFMSLITSLIFIGGDYTNFIFYLKLVFFCFCFIWVRSCFPRYRYDKLMYLAWKSYLPLSLNYLFVFILIKFLFTYHFFLWS
uniref:NADH-ubiquinone oxidoreductase chain 1 n=1 Tax=Pantaleon erectonodatus TaxID=3065215 RepID=A0AA95NLQ1_9HEMI|nr:NADH dehydrogenase subunit 1 [Pantaleon erectonodatus]WKZ08109.1 NADH dehydrogenase subunit 1 [Pantaleon erectonodatus]